MAERPIVGVTGNARRLSPSWWCTRLALWLAGARAHRISVRSDGVPRALDGLIIGGGDDIDPVLYGGEAAAHEAIDPERDRLEIRCIRTALERQIPLLGICRGAQLINVVLGGTLYQDIRPLRRRTSNRRNLLPVKRVSIASGSRLARICGSNGLRVNSLHSQAVWRVAPSLTAIARDADDFIQAVETSAGRPPLLGVQWHPEYLLYLPRQRAIFRWLVGGPGR